ncbi:MAG: hypothetical protein AAFQ19_04105 [Pseudomonadota bacterium]
MLRILVVVLSLLPMSAWALSCVPHRVSDAFLQAQAAPQSYVAVLGRITFDPRQVPRAERDWSRDFPPTTLIPATFDGMALGPRGVDQPFSADVVLEVTCSGPWCPDPQPGEMLGFLRKTSHSYVLETTACGQYMFGRPRTEQVQQLRDCLAGRRCQRTTRP